MANVWPAHAVHGAVFGGCSAGAGAVSCGASDAGRVQMMAGIALCRRKGGRD
ncbi:hypothetical protein FIBSPDRAFT_852843, partial [Athelia psychrophila]